MNQLIHGMLREQKGTQEQETTGVDSAIWQPRLHTVEQRSKLRLLSTVENFSAMNLKQLAPGEADGD